MCVCRVVSCRKVSSANTKAEAAIALGAEGAVRDGEAKRRGHICTTLTPTHARRGAHPQLPLHAACRR